MEYAKDEIFKIRYNSRVNRLQMPKESLGVRMIQKIKRHKWISLIVILFLMFSCINFFLIYHFMNILQTADFI